jgi:type IV pilus assembly protein PilV
MTAHQKKPVSYRRAPAGARADGFSLIEVLVAILVLAIGLLGLAALQARGLKFNHDSYARSQATFLAYDIIDLMRANAAGALAGNYVGVANPGNCDPSKPDDGRTLAARDLACWYASLGAVLPAGDATIAQNGNQIFITIRWQERGTREPTSRGECEAVPSRVWADPFCLVTQTWTVRI